MMDSSTVENTNNIGQNKNMVVNNNDKKEDTNKVDNNVNNSNFEEEINRANELKRNIDSLSQELHIQNKGYTTPNPLSKRQRKKKLKEEKWAAHAEERRLKRIQKRKEVKEKRRMEKKLGIFKKPQRIRECEQTPSPLRVVIDESFDNLMMDKEIKSMVSQITHCYSYNRQSVNPVKLYCTSFGDKTKAEFEDKKSDYQRWRRNEIIFESKPYEEVFANEKENLVYLTADSPNTINTFDESKIYIIGGIVDKNRYKNLTLEKAKKQNIATARLPINENIKMSSRKVLTVNHMFKIILNFLETKDWEKSLLEILPARKFNQDKSTTNSESDSSKSKENENDDNEESTSVVSTTDISSTNVDTTSTDDVKEN